MKIFKRSVFLVLLLLCFILASCATGKSVVSKSANLYKYQYASLTDVMNYNGDPTLMEAEVKIFDALEESRLTIIGDQRISELSSTQKEQLLLVRFSASQSNQESIVSVNFVDYMTGRPIASCKGSFGFGLDKNGDFNGAIKKVQSEIIKLSQLYTLRYQLYVVVL